MPKAKKTQDGLLDTWGRKNNRKHADKPCIECGEMFRPMRTISRYCTRQCAWKNNGGQNKKKETWWINAKGYIEGRIWIGEDIQIRVKQHRFIMEGILGRPLEANEDVHHIDGNNSNNTPSNLKLILHGEHSIFSNNNRTHKKGYKLNLTEEERHARSIRAIEQRLADIGRAAIAKYEEKP